MEQQLETFSTIFVSCFSPSNEFNFFSLSANAAYFQVHAGYEIIISDHSIYIFMTVELKDKGAETDKQRHQLQNSETFRS